MLRARPHHPPRHPSDGRGSAALVGLLLVVAVVAAGVTLVHRPAPASVGQNSANLSRPVASESSSPETSPTPDPTPRSSDVAVPPLPSAPPQRLLIAADATTGLTHAVDSGFDSTNDQTTGPLTASSANEVARLSSRGAVASPGTDTVVVVGATRTGAVLAEIGDLKAGATIRLRSAAGMLTYEVDDTSTVAAADLLDDPAVSAHEPGRLVLVGLGYDAPGARGDTDHVVVAHLVDARRH